MMPKLRGLVAATHTPFTATGSLNLPAVEAQAEALHRANVHTVFIAGTTGECHSLSLAERLALTTRWAEVTRGTPLRVIVHVGSNSLADARELASQAQANRVSAIAAVAPSYYKPDSLSSLIACCAEIASAAPELPFYYYEIPSLTGLRLAMPEFLTQAEERLPTLAGIKFSHSDLAAYQECLHAAGGRYDLPWGTDESLLAALAVGALGGVGSTYNFAAAIYHRLLAAFAEGDLARARFEQYRSVQLVSTLSRFGYMAAAKAMMGFLGLDVGPPRLPHRALTAESLAQLQNELEHLGFFDWLQD